MRHLLTILCALTTLFICNGCGSFSGNYSLSGSSINKEWETLYIAQIPNNALLQEPSLSQDLHLAFQDVFRNRTKLALTNTEESDLIIEAEIVSYDVAATAIQSNDVAANNRLTVGVKVRYINNKDESKSFDRTFSAYDEFPGTQTLSDAQSSILPGIINLIRDQVFAAIAMDW